jgi:3-oxoacyl-[acyl-carrier-protein] synthase-3
VERRVLAGQETALWMEMGAARRALKAAKLRPDEVEAVLITSIFPDQVLVGNAIWFAEAMGIGAPCWNTESACGSPTANLLMATSLVETGRLRNVLVVLSCSYSRALEEANPMSWTSGDGAAAFVVSEVPSGYGVKGSKCFSTVETSRAYDWEVKPHDVVKQTITFSATREAGPMLELTSEKYVPLACEAAVAASGLTMDDIQFAVFPTPTAWFAEFARAKLGLRADQTIDTYTRYSNTGPVLTPANLYHAAREGRIQPGDNVLFFSLGSASTCGAAVIRWSEVAVADDHD